MKKKEDINNQKDILKRRLFTIISSVLILPVGLYTKFYMGFGAEWVHNSLGGTLYVIFWCLVVYFIFPGARISIIAAGVLIVTCILEFTQLLNTPLLSNIRSTFIGRAMIGNSFNWFDFPYYFAGSFIGFFWMWFISKVKIRKNK